MECCCSWEGVPGSSMVPRCDHSDVRWVLKIFLALKIFLWRKPLTGGQETVVTRLTDGGQAEDEGGGKATYSTEKGKCQELPCNQTGPLEAQDSHESIHAIKTQCLYVKGKLSLEWIMLTRLLAMISLKYFHLSYLSTVLRKGKNEHSMDFVVRQVEIFFYILRCLPVKAEWLFWEFF